MKKAYLIGNISIKNQKIWKEYKSKVAATLIAYEGKIMFRGKTSKVLSGNYEHSEVVVIEFKNITTLNAWHESEEYQAIVPLRIQGANVDLVSYED